MKKYIYTEGNSTQVVDYEPSYRLARCFNEFVSLWVDGSNASCLVDEKFYLDLETFPNNCDCNSDALSAIRVMLGISQED